MSQDIKSDLQKSGIQAFSPEISSSLIVIQLSTQPETWGISPFYSCASISYTHPHWLHSDFCLLKDCRIDITGWHISKKCVDKKKMLPWKILNTQHTFLLLYGSHLLHSESLAATPVTTQPCVCHCGYGDINCEQVSNDTNVVGIVNTVSI